MRYVCVADESGPGVPQRGHDRSWQRKLVAVLTLLVLSGGPGLLQSAEPEVGKPTTKNGLLLRAAEEMRKAEAGLGAKPDLAKRIGVLSWALVVGEMASGRGGPELFTSANDAFDIGMKQLEALESLVREKPELEETISESPNLALRLDTVRVRLKAIQKNSTLSRVEERRRLESFRQMVRSYRNLTANLAAGNAQFLLGDHQNATKQHVESADRLADLGKVVTQPRMHWLFKDEPRLDDDKVTEADLVLTPALPFSDNIVAHVKALQALTAYRLAAPDGSTIKNAELIKNARAWAVESRDSNNQSGNSANGKVIPGFVIAQVDRCLALELTGKTPLSAAAHGQAKVHFDSARKALEEIAAVVSKPDSPFPGIVNEVTRRLEEVRTPTVFLESAAELTSRGLNAEAFAELGRGLAHHRSLALLLSRAEAGARDPDLLPRTLEELRQASGTGLLPANDPLAQMVRARCELARLRDQVVGRGTTPLSGADRQRMRQTLQGIKSQMDAVQKTAESGALGSRIAAYGSLAVAYDSLLTMGPAGEQETSALRLAKASAENLQVQLKTLRESDRLQQEIPLREALVAARLAQGHLAVRSLPEHRDTSSLAFTAAMDQQARLPSTGGETRLLGSVLMESLLNRTDSQQSRLAMEERQLRIIMTQFTQGSFALYWKQPMAASKEMSRALGRLRGTSGKPAVDLSDAANILTGNAGIDSPSDVLESITAFTSMSHVAARRPSEGLAVMMNQLSRDGVRVTGDSLLKQVDEDRLRSMISRIPTSLSGYALGLALENMVVQNPELSRGVASVCRRAAREMQQRVQKLLSDSDAARDRYQYLVDLNAEAVSRLEAPAPLLDQSRRFASQLRFQEADAVLRAGLLLHPGNDKLTAGLLENLALRCSQLQGQARSDQLALAIKELEKEKASERPGLAFRAARLLEMGGRTREALAAYKRSTEDKSASPEQKLVIEAKVALLTALAAVQ